MLVDFLDELVEVPHEKVAGMLLYAQTEEEGKFNNEYQMMGNRICVRTLDLSGDFQSIKKQPKGNTAGGSATS